MQLYSAQIGQTQLNADPIQFGQGSLMLQGGTIQESAALVNLSTGDVLDQVVPGELIYTRNLGGTLYSLYRVRHSIPVSQGNLVAIVVDGVQLKVLKVATFQFPHPGGITKFWTLNLA